ncbi:COG1361 S-layer family protein [Salinirubellus sp. GCM10025818]|uniref:COG1361 S-layer family protein n=1 Tax=Salinirubellus TaxID=2162630 RepID=UPI0030D1BA2C
MRGRRLLAVLFVGMLVLPGVALPAVTAGAAAAAPQAVGEPDLSVHVPQNELSPGETDTLALRISNSGTLSVAGADSSANRQVQTARGVDVTLDASGSAIRVETGETPIGSLAPGSVTSVPFQVVVPEGTDPGEHTLEVEVDYEWTSTVSSGGAQDTDTRTERFDVEVVVTDDARFAVADVSTDVAPGSSGETRVRLRNVGGERATNATVSVESTSGDIRFGQSASATQYVGGVPAGGTALVTVDTTAAAGTTTDRYALRATVSYDDPDGLPASDGPITFGISPVADDGLSLRNVSSTLAIGEQGTLAGTLTNDGPEPLRDATVVLQPKGETVLPVEPDQALGTVEPGESVPFEYPVRMAEGAEPGVRQLSMVVEYSDDSGGTHTSAPLNTRVEVAGAQSFALSNVESDLRVGSEGELRMTLTNQGPNTVHDAVVRPRASGTTLQPEGTEYAVGRLAPDESVNVTFPVDVTSAATAGPRQLSVVVGFRNGDGDARESDPLNARVSVAPPQDEFDLGSVETTLEAGSSGTVRLSITNNGNATLANVNAKAFVDDPLTVDTDEAYVPELAPGESTEIAFDVSAASDAPTRAHPLEIDFQYDEPDGDTKLSDTYQVPLTVEESSGGGVSLTLLGVGLVLVLGAVGGLVYVRR